ncbi:MAG: L,D-transpeptidase family protein [Gammaproteobacteria bacterium]|jgi:L,D-transpeptidase ErfK/SrfK|nr:L,D-transpeptidase family protein [Gammaproteobacteria bacterium]
MQPKSFRRLILALKFCLLGLSFSNASAEIYELTSKEDSVVGEIQKTWARSEDTLLDIARANGLGYHEIKRINPTLDTWLPGSDKEVVLPSKYVLPMAKRDGIILNIPEMRLYFFPKVKPGEEIKVVTYPLGIGRQGWQTPYINTRVIEKKKHPYWHPPESIRKEHEAAGDPLPKRVEPGPDNPLGDYAMRLGLPDYLIHGTNKPFGIGMRVSHGCIRLYPEDIEELFPQVKLRTPVRIVNQPYKVGRLDDKIYLEAHPYLEEDSDEYKDNLTSVVKMIVKLTDDQDYQIEWELAKQVIREMNGIPIVIGRLSQTQIDAGLDDVAETTLDKGISLQLETGIAN